MWIDNIFNNFETNQLTYTWWNVNISFDYKQLDNTNWPAYLEISYDVLCWLYWYSCNRETINFQLNSTNWITFNKVLWPWTYRFKWINNQSTKLFVDNIILNPTINPTVYDDSSYWTPSCQSYFYYKNSWEVQISDSNYLDTFENNPTSQNTPRQNTDSNAPCYFSVKNSCAYDTSIINSYYTNLWTPNTPRQDWQDSDSNLPCYYERCISLPYSYETLYKDWLNWNFPADSSSRQNTDSNAPCYYTIP